MGLVRYLAGAALVMGALWLVRPAQACGFPQLHAGGAFGSGELIVLPYGSNAYATHDGIVISRDGGATWGLVCASAIAAQGAVLRGPVVLARGGLPFVVSVAGGVYGGDATGCQWSVEEALADRHVDMLAVDPTDDEVLYAWAAGARADARELLRSDAPNSWQAVTTESEWLPVSMWLVGRGDGPRIYVSAARATDGGFESAVRVSDDAGQSFRTLAGDTGATFEIAAVAPGEPDRLAIAVSDGTGLGAVELRVSEDGGESFRPYLPLPGPALVTLTPGGRAFIAAADAGFGGGGGLWTADRLGARPTRLRDDGRWACLHHDPQEDVLYGCEPAGFGRVDPQTGALTRMLDLANLEAVAECPGRDLVGVCEAALATDGCAYCSATQYPCAPICRINDADRPDGGVQATCGGPMMARDGSVGMPDAGTAPASDGGRDTSTPAERAAGRGGPRDASSVASNVDATSGGSGGGCTLALRPASPVGATWWPIALQLLGLWRSCWRRRIPRVRMVSRG